MRFISKVKDFFKDVAFKLRIEIKFKPFVYDQYMFKCLKKIDIDEEIHNMFHAIKYMYSKEYKKLIQDFEKCKIQIESHNKKVTAIAIKKGEFDYDRIIKNPFNFDFCQLYSYLEIVKKIEDFTYVEDEYKVFCKNVLDIKENFEVIKIQYSYYNEINYIINSIPNDRYIDGEIIDKIKLIIEKIKKYKKIYYNFYDLVKYKKVIENINNIFIEKYKNDHFFTILKNDYGWDLTDEQREAILTDELATLVVAGAGSGKTRTICCKAKYLVEKLKVDPKDILLLSYTNDSANELNKRLKQLDERLEASTLHSLGLKILAEFNGIKPTCKNNFDEIVDMYFDEIMKSDSKKKMLHKILEFCAYYLSYEKNTQKYTEKGQLYRDLKGNVKRTLKGECVKSYEELAIANFYFINGIKYKYEQKYKYKTSSKKYRQYYPDFYLSDYDLWHEHYGVNRDFKAMQYKDELADEYVQSIKWKRETHEKYGTICLETYSYLFSEGTIFEELEKILKQHNVKFNPLSNKEIVDALQKNNKKDFLALKKMLKTFISLYKSKYRDETMFSEFKKKKFHSLYEKYRVTRFLDIAEDLYLYYKKYLKDNEEIDFDDMILQSASCLSKLDKFLYKYIIVDEFQDISDSRFEFIKALIKHNNAKLFAVGDDWQSIYRFSGADLNLFLSFKSKFEYSKICILNDVFRNSQALNDIASKFILKNKRQIKKKIKSNSYHYRDQKPIKIMYYDDNKEKENKIFDILEPICMIGSNIIQLKFIQKDRLNII